MPDSAVTERGVVHVPVALDGEPVRHLGGLPLGFKPEAGKTYPALFVLDGYHNFQTALDMGRKLRQTIGEVFVISIGSPFEEGEDPFTRRHGAYCRPEAFQIKGFRGRHWE